MAAVPPPPPPPPPCRSQPVRIRSAPCPAHAAVPYCDSLAIQEALLEDAPATPPLPLLFPVPQGLEENPHDSVEKTGPVQETNPAAQAPISPQITEQQQETAIQVDQLRTNCYEVLQ